MLLCFFGYYLWTLNYCSYAKHENQPQYSLNRIILNIIQFFFKIHLFNSRVCSQSTLIFFGAVDYQNIEYEVLTSLAELDKWAAQQSLVLSETFKKFKDYGFSKKRSKSNWTEWSTIQGVIAIVISKTDEREAWGRFEITSTITVQLPFNYPPTQSL